MKKKKSFLPILRKKVNKKIKKLGEGPKKKGKWKPMENSPPKELIKAF